MSSDFGGFKIGKGKKLQVKNLEAANSFLADIQKDLDGDGKEDPEDLLQKLKANPNKGNIESFDAIAQKEIDIVNASMKRSATDPASSK